MSVIKHNFSGKTVTYHFEAGFSDLEGLVNKDQTIVITDEHIYQLHPNKFDGWKVIVLKAGEAFKQQAAVNNIIQQLMVLEADRKTFIVGVGGGVVTDIAGFAACIYMRGLPFGFVPTTILGMVDASIGGKNGVDVGFYKNLVGTIRQPEFILFDLGFLNTLPEKEWVNGFAEIIKHAAIKDPEMFAQLEKHKLSDFRDNKALLQSLVENNVAIKTSIVLNDEYENGERKLLNFGHSFGHAIENLYQLPHGHAISIGMVLAGTISAATGGFKKPELQRLIKLLAQYELPVQFDFKMEEVLEIMKMDKKKEQDSISFILLKKIGEAYIQSIPFNKIPALTAN